MSAPSFAAQIAERFTASDDTRTREQLCAAIEGAFLAQFGGALIDADAAADAWLVDGARTRDRIGNAASDNMRFGFIEGFKAARLRGEAAQGEQQAVARPGDECSTCSGTGLAKNGYDCCGTCVGAGETYRNHTDNRPQPVAVAGDAVRAAIEVLREQEIMVKTLPVNETKRGWFAAQAQKIRDALAGLHTLSAAPAAPESTQGEQYGAGFEAGFADAVEQFKLEESTPVAWIGHSADGIEFEVNKAHCEANPDYWQPLYTRQPAAPAPVAGLSRFRDLAEFALRNAGFHNCWAEREQLARDFIALIEAAPVAGDAVAKLPDDVQQMIATDDASWALAKLAESFGAERDEDDDSTWWVLRIDQFRALAQDRASQGAAAGYRMLRPNEVIQKGDEFLQDDSITWERAPGFSVGMNYRAGVLLPARRATAPSAPTQGAEREVG